MLLLEGTGYMGVELGQQLASDAAQESMFRFGSGGARSDRGACHLTGVVKGLR
jgi:hypothetical protein